MARSVWPRAAATLLIISAAGCSIYERQQRPAWRTQAENACLAQKLVHVSTRIQPAQEIDGPGICGLTHPFKVAALADGSVALDSQATLACSMIPALDQWLAEAVVPAAQARFGEAIVEIKTMGSYGCRGINNQRGAKLSEHAFGNAIDISGFVLASGREISIMRGWKGGDEQERAFLREAHAGACRYFTTVLGPGSNAFHYNHFHVDLATHGNTSTGLRRYCSPQPDPDLLPAPPKQDNLPEPPMIEEEMDIARAGPPGRDPDYAVVARAPVAAVPAPLSAPMRAPVMAIHEPLQLQPNSIEALIEATRPIPPAPIPNTRIPVRQITATHPASRPPQKTPAPFAPEAPEGSPSDWDLTSAIN